MGRRFIRYGNFSRCNYSNDENGEYLANHSILDAFRFFGIQAPKQGLSAKFA